MTQVARRPNPIAATGAAALLVAIAGYIGSASGFPTVRSPLPLATTLPIFWFWMAVHEASSLRWIIEYAIPALVGPFLLLAWHPRLLNGVGHVPRRSVIGLLLLSLLTFIDFVLGWKYGIKYQGKEYTTALLVLNVTAIGTAWVLVGYARKRAEFVPTLAAHTFVTAWLVWVAFPWLGELP